MNSSPGKLQTTRSQVAATSAVPADARFCVDPLHVLCGAGEHEPAIVRRPDAFEATDERVDAQAPRGPACVAAEQRFRRLDPINPLAIGRGIGGAWNAGNEPELIVIFAARVGRHRAGLQVDLIRKRGEVPLDHMSSTGCGRADDGRDRSGDVVECGGRGVRHEPDGCERGRRNG